MRSDRHLQFFREDCELLSVPRCIEGMAELMDFFAAHDLGCLFLDS